ncbi:Cd(II)/Pb(II)-responsive transcriptional regulator [Synechococcus sp. CS-602]|uniref:Cd(II)/Pb(II)-responsive transcriptional regulator n=1 Tax=Synechococcus sp. CS-602 TaxID=2847982 RepID=UPI00223BBEF6|nr:Cd(II)/Pb(II)-responsive transcriptional regulator [Synechococcus sp. CS-602]
MIEPVAIMPIVASAAKVSFTQAERRLERLPLKSLKWLQGQGPNVPYKGLPPTGEGGSMQIGELARATGVKIETIRYYEREHLLPVPQRTDGNYRLYSPQHVEQLRFIRFCRSLDMSLEEVRVLIGARDAPAGSCRTVNALLDEKMAEVDARVDELRQLQHQLRNLRGLCPQSDEVKTCGILVELTRSARSNKAQI